MKEKVFDDWPVKYDEWFASPLGKRIKQYESEVILDFTEPAADETHLDVGCGTGIFTQDLLDFGPYIIGVDISLPMLLQARKKLSSYNFSPAASDMLYLPFADSRFDKVVSITAVEFVQNARQAVREMFRVAKPGATIVLATLNKLSSWAQKRSEKARKGHDIFSYTIFRSPQELLDLATVKGEVKTAVHFQKDSPLEEIPHIEKKGQQKGLLTGAFVAVKWIKQS